MFNTKPTVSIILPIYNVEPYLRECIDSCIGQVDAPDFEIILVDDGSTDNCGAICDEYASLHDNIKVVHQPNSDWQLHVTPDWPSPGTMDSLCRLRRLHR